jgi:phytoene dehydrogenase-like protein
MLEAEKVLIIGSGVGGLSTGIILAGLGYEVTVLEKNRDAGGLLRSYGRSGIQCATGVHYLGSLDSGQVLRTFFDYLGVSDSIPLSRMGEDGVVDRYLFDRPESHPSHFDFPASIDAYESNLLQVFPAEKATIKTVISGIRHSARQLHNLDILYTGDTFSLLDETRPFGEILDGLGCSPGLRSVFAIASSWIGVPLSQCPTYYHNMALASYLSSSWRLEQSGSDMAMVLVKRLEELGGRVICNAQVEAVQVENRVVRGVQLGSGEKLSASIVIGAIHPQVLLEMLPQGAVKPSYRNRIGRIENSHSVFAVHALVDSAAHPEVPYNIFKVETDERGDISDLRYFQFRKSERPEATLFSILTSGYDELWRPWLESSTGRRGKEYEALKMQQARELLVEAEDIFGPLQGLKILDVSTPLTIRDWTGSPDGSAYGVLRSSGQMLATAMLNRTAVKGLYLAGQNVLAPGLIGTIMGSFSTVKLILGAERFNKSIRLQDEP